MIRAKTGTPVFALFPSPLKIRVETFMIKTQELQRNPGTYKMASLIIIAHILILQSFYNYYDRTLQ